MVLRKITIDKSVRFFPITKKSEEADINPKKLKTGSLPRKQNTIISQNNKKFLKNVANTRICNN